MHCWFCMPHATRTQSDVTVVTWLLKPKPKTARRKNSIKNYSAGASKFHMLQHSCVYILGFSTPLISLNKICFQKYHRMPAGNYSAFVSFSLFHSLYLLSPFLDMRKSSQCFLKTNCMLHICEEIAAVLSTTCLIACLMRGCTICPIMLWAAKSSAPTNPFLGSSHVVKGSHWPACTSSINQTFSVLC